MSCYSNYLLLHLLLDNRIRKIVPLKHSSMHIASQTPCSPIVFTNSADNVMRTVQMLNRFIMQGISVSPAPTKTPYDTIDAANIGSAKASMRSASMVSDCTNASGVMSCITHGAVTYIIMPINVIMPMPIPTVMRAKLRASCGRPAPKLCPTSVVADSPMPYPGM